MFFGLSTMMRFSLLQIRSFRDFNPAEYTIVAVSAGILLILALLIHIIRINTPVDRKKRKMGAGRRYFTAFTLRRVAKAYDLNREQTRLLEQVFRNDSVADPERVMKIPDLLDRHFMHAFKAIEKNSATDEEAQIHLYKLFALRYAIDAAPDPDAISFNPSENTPAILTNGKETFPVKIIRSQGHDVITDIPKNILGSPIRFNARTPVTLLFFSKSSSGYSVNGHVIGAVNTDFGAGLHITHSGKKKPLAQRKYRRRQTDMKCEFFFVTIQETGKGRRKETKLVVETKKFLGNLMDISVGGCSIKTQIPIPVSSRLKIKIDYDNNHIINALGLVLRSNRSNRGTILHIKFLKVPAKAYVAISTLAFGFGDD